MGEDGGNEVYRKVRSERKKRLGFQLDQILACVKIQGVLDTVLLVYFLLL